MPPTDRVLGCELWVPDTAIFELGKPKLVVKTDPVNGCIMRYKKTPTLTDLRKQFAIVSRERKKEPSPFDTGNKGFESKNTPEQDQLAKQQYLDQFDSNNPPPPTRLQRDSMIFRFKADPKLCPELDPTNQVEVQPLMVVKVLSELDFINEFKRPPGHTYWQTIDLIQTTLKITALSGLGKQFNFTFNAPCYKSYKDRSRLPPKNVHPCAADDDEVDPDGDGIEPPPQLVEHSYDGKIEFNF